MSKRYNLTVNINMYSENMDKALKVIRKQLDKLERECYFYQSEITDIKEIK